MVFFSYKTIDIEDVLKYDKERFNSNNHPPRPDDYVEVLDACQTYKWIDNFHTNYESYIIDADIAWMQRAKIISQQTNKFTGLFQDEINDVVDFSFNPCFIRTENVSLKYGQHGVGPYTNIKQVIESIVTTIPGHTPLYDDIKTIKIYLLPWLKMSEWKEFRVFVYNKRITAISQQNLFAVYQELSGYIESFITIIINYFQSVVKGKIELDSYVYDFVILEDGTPYFIEINSFGKQYASGSALFHWLLDEDILYGNGENIEVRYTIQK